MSEKHCRQWNYFNANVNSALVFDDDGVQEEGDDSYVRDKGDGVEDDYVQGEGDGEHVRGKGDGVDDDGVQDEGDDDHARGEADGVDDDGAQEEGDGEPLCDQREAQQQPPCNPLLISTSDFFAQFNFFLLSFVVVSTASYHAW